jgi:hypothetical protein
MNCSKARGERSAFTSRTQAAAVVRRFLKVKLVDIVGIKHRRRP